MPHKKPIRYCRTCKIPIYSGNKYDFCWLCYCKSDERKGVARKCVDKRQNYDGQNNPNYRGKTKFTCPCGLDFFRRISPSQENMRVHLYCSTKCKKKYSISKMKICEYKGLQLRSSWELAFAQYLDSKNYNWKYEPENFETSYGFYTARFLGRRVKVLCGSKGIF